MNKKDLSDKILCWYDMGIFPAHLMFSCGFTQDELNMHLKRKKAKQWIAGMAAEINTSLFNGKAWGWAVRHVIKHDQTGEEVTLFHVHIRDKFDFSDESFIKLAHEIVHVCQFFLPDVLNRDREYEAEAYLHTYLMRNIIKDLRNFREKKK